MVAMVMVMMALAFVAPMCVFHSNGKAAKPLMKLVFKCKHEGAWIVPKGGNISRAETLFKTTH